MRAILVFGILILAGCRSGPTGLVVTGSAYVESERPEGRAVAKVEVQYRPPNVPARETGMVAVAAASTPVSLGAPVEVLARK
jgi:hypothetical protein